MKKLGLILSILALAGTISASSNGAVRHLQPQRVPVILVNYSDVNLTNTDFNAYATSLAKYFSDNSFGKYQPQFDIIGPVTLSSNRSYYGANDEYGDDVRAAVMMADACNAAEGLADFTVYDQDGDGRIDALAVIYAGEGERMDNNLPDAVWEFTDDLETTEELEYIVQLDGKTVAACCAVPELQSKTKRDGIGTFIHEFAHILGLPNFCTTDGGIQKTLGDWDVMDHGCYNNSANTPAAMSAYERWYLGWIEPILLDEPMNVRLRDLNTSGDCAIITQTGQSNLNGLSPDPRKFYILENRQQSGWDEYIPGHGLMLTYIDYVKNKWESDEVNNVENHPCVDLIEADGSAPKYKADNLTNGYFGKQGDLFTNGYSSKNMFSNAMNFSNAREQGGVVLFDFNGGVGKCTVTFSVTSSMGTCATASATESTKGAGVTLPSVTAKTGYTFLGWATRKNSTVADAGQPGDIYYPMCDGSVFAVMQDNTRFWVNYPEYKGVTIEEYIGFNGAYVTKPVANDIAVTYVKKDGYQTPTADNCFVRVECGGTQLQNTTRFSNDSIFVTIPASAITGDIYITVRNVREQDDENGCAPYSHVFTKSCSAGTQQDLSGYNWDVTFGDPMATTNFDSSKGAVFGSNSYPVGLLKFYTDETMGCGIKRVRVQASAPGDATLSVYVAGSQVGTSEALSATTEEYTFELDELTTGTVDIRLENTQKAIYVKAINIDFEKIDDPIEPQGIEPIASQQPTNASRKMLINGQLYIFFNGHMYNALGAKIK